jgi:hypothetical protein
VRTSQKSLDPIIEIGQEANNMGVLSAPVEALARMFADCRPFAAWLGNTWNATETARRIYVDGIGPEGDAETLTAEQLAAVRPFCLLYPDQRGYRFKLEAMPACYSGNGQVVAVLSRSYDPTKSLTDHWKEAAAAVEKILSNDTPGEPGLMEMANTSGYLAFTSLEVTFLGRTPPESVVSYGDAYDVLLVFEY